MQRGQHAGTDRVRIGNQWDPLDWHLPSWTRQASVYAGRLDYYPPLKPWFLVT
jgi:hypothetical protein